MRHKAPAQLSERIGAMIIKRCVSRRILAKRIGVSGVGVIIRWESGEQAPSAYYLALLAKELGTTSDYLLGLTDDFRGK